MSRTRPLYRPLIAGERTAVAVRFARGTYELGRVRARGGPESLRPSEYEQVAEQAQSRWVHLEPWDPKADLPWRMRRRVFLVEEGALFSGWLMEFRNELGEAVLYPENAPTDEQFLA